MTDRLTPESMWKTGHLGRSFVGTPLEDDCPCPKAPCGLVIANQRDPSCEQHHPSKTIRQGHPADQCPGAKQARPENIVERYDPSTVFLRQKITALRRIAAELRGFFDAEARQEPEVQAILRDCDTLDQIASEITNNSIPAGK